MGDGREACAASKWAASHAGAACPWPLPRGQPAGSFPAAGEASIGADRAFHSSPVLGADSEAGAARRFHRHLHMAAMEFEKMCTEKAAMSVKLRSLQTLPCAAGSDQPRSSRHGGPEPTGTRVPFSHLGQPGSRALAYAIPPPPILREVHVADFHLDAPPSVTGADSDVIGCCAVACADSYANEQECGGEVSGCADFSSRTPGYPGSENWHGGENGREHSHEPGAQGGPSHSSLALELRDQELTASTLPCKTASKSRCKPRINQTNCIGIHAHGAATDDRVKEAQPRDEPSACSAAFLRIVSSPYFDSLTCGVIVMNAICLAFQMQQDGMIIGCGLELEEYAGMDPDKIWPFASQIFLILDIAFNAFFCFELVLRCVVYRMKFFRSMSNWFDIAIVCLGVMSSVVPNITVARLLRLSRLSRIRVLKMNEWVGSLRLILTSIVKSQQMMIWSLCMMVVVQSIVGLTMSSLLLSYMENPDNDLEARQEVFYFYGTFIRTMISLFEVHLANWSPACRVLFDNVGLSWALGFVFYRCVVGFSLLNVIGAVFIQTTMKAAQNATDSKILAKQQEQRQHATELMAFFETLDTSKDGFVSLEELQQVADVEYCRDWLAALEIEPHDLHAIFRALDVNGDGLVAPHELIVNASRIKGHAKRLDVVDILAHIKVLEAKLDHMSRAPPASAEGRAM